MICLKYLMLMVKWGISMGMSYRKLWVMLAHKEISKQQYREELGIALRTNTKLNFI